MVPRKDDLEKLFDLSPEAIFLESADGTVVDVNEQACEMLGYAEEELVDKDVAKIVPDDSPVYAPEEVNAATSQGEPIETVNLNKAGEEVPVELRGKPIEVNGEKRILVSLRDITERKQMEKELKEANRKLKESKERYKSYFDELGDAIYITRVGGENQGEILDVNSRAVEQTGYSESELIGMNIEEDLVKGEPESTSYEKGDEKLSRGELVSFTERKVSKDGSDYWTECVATPIEYEGQDASLSINRDITEKRKAKLALQEERDKLEALHGAVDRLQQENEESEVLNTAVELAEGILGFELCTIGITEGDRVSIRAFSDKASPYLQREFDIGEGIVGKTAKEGETIWGADLEEFPEAKSEEVGFESFISVPIGDLGTINVAAEKRDKFTREDVDLVEILAGHLREELKRVRLQKELREQAIKDPLTGLYNRRYFNESLRKEVEKSKRYDSPIAFVMIDVNRFKEINDRYSHQTGDQVLVQVADLIGENVRSADTVVRYGGDEFLIMLPETNGEVSSTVSRILERLERWNEESNLLDFRLTFALGVSHWDPERDRKIETVLKEADRKMYEDKP